ncbi:hypothetical protein D0809_00060 [Flavobacterium circumlabens]|nr:hypothetical protein D0809_00060 [Flavobacterium circumlabens]
MNNQLKIILILLSLGSIFLAYDRFEKNRSFNHLMGNFEMTRGKVLKVFISNKTSLRGGSARNDITYSYLVGSEHYVTKNIENEYIVIPNITPKTNCDYIVIYQKGNPNNSILLLNYPVNSSEDLERYKEIFKDKIPEDAIKQD